MKKILVLFVAIFSLFLSHAQQDEQINFYMQNTLLFNPAFAGAKGEFNALIMTRNQWVGMKGAPVSQFVSAHAPIRFKNMSVGGHLSNDKIGSRSRTSIYADYSYTLNFKNDKKLNFGVSGGGEQISINYMDLMATDPNDPLYWNTIAQFKMNFGAGIYYHSPNFYVGISVPRLNQTKLETNGFLISGAFIKRHYYLTAGHRMPLNSHLTLCSSFLLKMVENAPITLDLNAMMEFKNNFTVGALYRYNNAIGFNFLTHIDPELQFGYSFDYPTSSLSSVGTMGSHELLLMYTLGGRRSLGSPRYF